MVRSSFVAAAIIIASASLMPASAGVVTVSSVSASQYNYPWFGATVVAYGTADLANVHLVRTRADGTTEVVVPDEVTRYVLDGAGKYVQWNLVKYATEVVRPGDEVTAVVHDTDGASDEHTVPCVTGSKKKKSQETALCR